MVELKDIQTANHGTYYTGENMIIEDPLEMGSAVRSIIETNPLTQLLTKEKAALSNVQQSYESVKHDTLELKRRVNNSLVEQNVYKQLVRKSELKVKHLEKTVENSTSDFKCDFLDREAMAQFFESIGLRFISLNISQSGSEARLSYVRPPRLISTLPVQPMIVTMYYELKNGTLRFKRPDITTVLSSSNYMHPHISGDTVCLGNFFDVFTTDEYSVHLDGYQDQVILLENLLSTFNPDSPYARIDQIISGICKRVEFSSIDFTVARSNNYTFINPKLDTSNQSYFYAHDLITEEMYRDFYAMLGNMTIAETAQDTIDLLPNVFCDGDSDSENYERFENLQESLNKMFGIRLPHPENYGNYNEDDDYYELDESSAEDLIDSWINVLEPLTQSDDHFEFSNLPDLEEIFPKPQAVELLTEEQLSLGV